jgi:hypothetical protein
MRARFAMARVCPASVGQGLADGDPLVLLHA